MIPPARNLTRSKSKVYAGLVLFVLVAVLLLYVSLSPSLKRFDQAVLALKLGEYSTAARLFEEVSNRQEAAMFHRTKYKQARRFLTELYALGLGVERNRERALTFLGEDNEHAAGLCHSLGDKLTAGKLVPRDLDEAQFWYSESKQRGWGSDSSP